MKSFSKTIVIIGFKHVGKTVVGKALARKLNKIFIDLDDEIEKFFSNQRGKLITCREIVQECGENYFRNLEMNILEKIITTQNAIITLGGGAVVAEKNQKLISETEVIYLDAPYDMVCERIRCGGVPSFFDPNKSFEINLLALWNPRKAIYEKLAKFKILNDKSINAAVNAIINKMFAAKNEGSSNGKSQEATTC